MSNLSGALPRRAVLWFRNDLRLHDNASLSSAAALVKKGAAEHVLPVYVFDPRHFGTTAFGSPKTGKYRARFLMESVQDLKSELRCVPSMRFVAIDTSTALKAASPATRRRSIHRRDADVNRGTWPGWVATTAIWDRTC
jgi:deoxyribodipyrimidine photolyase